jgi:hypothetical protein
VAALPEELAPHAVAALRETAFRLVSSAKLVSSSDLADDPLLAQEFFRETAAILTELNDRLTQVYFSHSDVLEPIR